MLTELIQEARSFVTLQSALGWAMAKRPPVELVTVVAQDEFTHDVVFRAAENAFLVFDTT